MPTPTATKNNKQQPVAAAATPTIIQQKHERKLARIRNYLEAHPSIEVPAYYAAYLNNKRRSNRPPRHHRKTSRELAMEIDARAEAYMHEQHSPHTSDSDEGQRERYDYNTRQRHKQTYRRVKSGLLTACKLTAIGLAAYAFVGFDSDFLYKRGTDAYYVCVQNKPADTTLTHDELMTVFGNTVLVMLICLIVSAVYMIYYRFFKWSGGEWRRSRHMLIVTDAYLSVPTWIAVVLLWWNQRVIDLNQEWTYSATGPIALQDTNNTDYIARIGNCVLLGRYEQFLGYEEMVYCVFACWGLGLVSAIVWLVSVQFDKCTIDWRTATWWPLFSLFILCLLPLFTVVSFFIILGHHWSFTSHYTFPLVVFGTSLLVILMSLWDLYWVTGRLHHDRKRMMDDDYDNDAYS